ncbi:hypothetical protein [Qipengyuania aurantiaca]
MKSSDERQLAIGERHSYPFAMLLILLFLLGVGNFAVHKAVLESGHPMLDALPSFYRSGGGRFSLGFEFVLLLAAMLLTANGWAGMAIAYAIYSLFNFATGWLILSGRI